MKVSTRLGILLPVVVGALLLATSAAASAAPAAAPTAAPPGSVVFSGQFQIQNLAYGQCVVPASTSKNATLRLADCRSSGSRAVWTFVKSGDINFISNKATGWCMEVNDGTMIPGERVDQFDCNGSGAVQWYELPTRAANGAFYLEIRNAHSNLCLDTVAGRGSDLMQYVCDGNDAQLWILH